RARGGRLEGGSAVVEFALVLPVLLTLCLALGRIGLSPRHQLLLLPCPRADRTSPPTSASLGAGGPGGLATGSGRPGRRSRSIGRATGRAGTRPDEGRGEDRSNRGTGPAGRGYRGLRGDHRRPFGWSVLPLGGLVG